MVTSTLRKRALLALVFLLIAPAYGSGQAGEPGSELRVWLVTAGPGEAVWERYGHNALRVLDTRTGYDVSFNWGIFSFGQPVQFIIRFLQGRMVYTMAPFDTGAMLAAYARDGRAVVQQELDLTPSEKLELLMLAETNARPENRDYVYQYFLDNCSTRIRDLLDRIVGGQLTEAFGSVETETSYRWHTQRLTQVDPFIYAGMDALLGGPTDQELTVWEEMFLPLTLRDRVRDVTVRRPDGSQRALVLNEESTDSGTGPSEEAAPPAWLISFLALGLLSGATFSSLSLTRVRDSRLWRRVVLGMACAWSGLFGLLGMILVALLFTDHLFAWRNENLFLANPLLVASALALPLSYADPSWQARARWISTTCAGVALLGLMWHITPWSVHQNGSFIALLLPAHLGLAWGLRATPQSVPSDPAALRD